MSYRETLSPSRFQERDWEMCNDDVASMAKVQSGAREGARLAYVNQEVIQTKRKGEVIYEKPMRGEKISIRGAQQPARAVAAFSIRRA